MQLYSASWLCQLGSPWVEYFHRRQSLPTESLFLTTIRGQFCLSTSLYKITLLSWTILELWLIWPHCRHITGSTRCPSCNLPVCSAACAQTSLHAALECKHFAKHKDRYSPGWVEAWLMINVMLNQIHPQEWRGSLSFNPGTPPPPPAKAPTQSPLHLPTACHTLRAVENHPRLAGRPGGDCHVS